MDRRTALKLLGSSLALSSMKGKAAPDANILPWKIGLGLNGFASASKKYSKTFPIWEVLDFASRTGFDGIELVGGWPMGDYPKADEKDRIVALKRLHDAFGLRIFSIQTSAGRRRFPRLDQSRHLADPRPLRRRPQRLPGRAAGSAKLCRTLIEQMRSHCEIAEDI